MCPLKPRVYNERNVTRPLRTAASLDGNSQPAGPFAPCLSWDVKGGDNRKNHARKITMPTQLPSRANTPPAGDGLADFCAKLVEIHALLALLLACLITLGTYLGVSPETTVAEAFLRFPPIAPLPP